MAGFSIRGQNSTRDGGNNPLIVLDGAIYDGSLADIPSEDIESFTVLKDASAAAVYGSRSSNGVILIQTKRVHNIVCRYIPVGINIRFSNRTGYRLFV